MERPPEILGSAAPEPRPDPPEVIVRRSPLTYSPRSTTQLNTARLPPQAAWAGMALSYRRVTAFTPMQRAFATGNLVSLSYGVLVLIVVLALSRADVPITLGNAFTIAAFVGFVCVIPRMFSPRDRPLRIFVTRTLAPPAAVLAIYLTAYVNPLALTRFLLAASTLALFARFGSDPIRLFQDWLRTHPAVTPDTCHDAVAHAQAHARPDLRLLIAVLAIAVFVGPRSPTLAIALILVVSLRGAGPFPVPPTRLRFFRDILPLYFSYGLTSTVAPGMWIPEPALATRRRRTYALATSLFLALALTLALFCPWDLVNPAAYYHSDDRKHALDLLRSEPWAWLVFFLDRLRARGRSLLVLNLAPVAFGLSSLVPAAVVNAIYRPALRATEALRDALSQALAADTRPEWQWYADRLRPSCHEAPDPLSGVPVREAEHIFLGIEPHQRFPILLHRPILAEHAYIVGESGAGKTSLGILTLVLPLLRSARTFAPNGTPHPLEETPPPPLVVIDLKGDKVLFNTLRDEVKARTWRKPDGEIARQRFLFFTLERGDASDHFNPFTSFGLEHRTLAQLCELVLSSLDLNHGAGYGRGYYTALSRQALSRALRYLQSRKEPITFESIQHVLMTRQEVGDARSRREAFHLTSIVEALAGYDQLNTKPEIERDDPEHVIHMPRVLEERQVVYFWLPTIKESISVREVGQLALYAFLNAAIDRQHAGQEPRQAYLVIDEFQCIASRGFQPILQHARQLGVGCILANQTQGDLNTPDIDLRSTVRATTRVKMHFAVTDPREVADLIETSGEEIASMHSWSDSPFVARKPGYIPPVHPTGPHPSVLMTKITESWSDTLKPRFTRNDIAAVSDHPHDFIVHVSRGSGYTQFAGLPFVARSTWPVTRDDRDRRENAPWPAPVGQQVAASRSHAEVDEGARTSAEGLAAATHGLQGELDKIAAAHEAPPPSPQRSPRRPRNQR